MPTDNSDHTLFRMGTEIISCGGSQINCYTYFTSNNSWALYRNANSSYAPRSVYKNKMYFSYYAPFSQVLDLGTKEMASWPAAPQNNCAGCQVTWYDTFIRFGGSDLLQRVLEFNHTTQNWRVLLDNAPMDFYNTGCILIADDKVLLAGSAYGTSPNKFTVFDIKSKHWVFNGTLSSYKMAPNMLSLGTRTFMLYGSYPTVNNEVLEFHPSNNSFTTVASWPRSARAFCAALSVPARLFRNMLASCTGVS